MVGQNSAFTTYLELLAYLLPIFIAAIAGIVFSGLNWKKAFTPALAGVIGCTVLLLFSCIFPALQVWMPRMVLGQNPGMDALSRLVWTSRIITISSHSCTAVCFGALIFAAFAERAAAGKKNKKKRDRDDDEEDEDDQPRRRKSADDEAVSEKPTSKKRRRMDDD